jgi:hypothetical protein
MPMIVKRLAIRQPPTPAIDLDGACRAGRMLSGTGWDLDER